MNGSMKYVLVTLGACLLVMALPLFGHGNATLSRTLYLSAFVLWLLPLTALQRALWRRGTPGWRIALVLLATTYAMALAKKDHQLVFELPAKVARRRVGFV